MNDDFIYAALPKVPKDFAQSLYVKISVDTHPQSRIHSRLRNPRWVQVAIIILGVLLLVAWSQVRLWVRYVPIGDLWLVELSRQTQIVPGDQFATPFIPTPRQLPTVVRDGKVYEFWKLEMLSPDWIPDGFFKMEIPRSMNSYEETIGLWSNDADEKIRLYAVPQAGGMHPYAPPGMYEEVQVNGQPAILVHGRLALKKPQENSRKWDETLGIQLSWSLEESVYTLETFGPYVSEYDLIRMAESMKVVPWWAP
ncbi:MAG: DUF4367 domain-containing protein [Anaerolineae bacterium]|nr:DUF4367 domain-containing protein [Anaerolineae bacterium]